MRCFLHFEKEAVAICMNCGKAMCMNCSSYTTHSGKCPICIKAEYTKELVTVDKKNNSIRNLMIIYYVVSALLIGLFVFLAIWLQQNLYYIGTSSGVIFIILALFKMSAYRKSSTKINYYNNEIAKINHSIKQGNIVL